MLNYQRVSADDFKNILLKPAPEILVYMLQVSEISRRNPDWAPVISFRDIPKEAPKTLPREFGWLFCGDGEAPRYNLRSEEDALKTLKSYVPFLDCLQLKGNYCLAGSCPVVACLFTDPDAGGRGGAETPGDADFYPYYNPLLRKTVPDEQNIMASYQTFINDLNELCDPESKVGKRHPYMSRSSTYRNRHCTTTALPADDETNMLMARAIPPPGFIYCCRSFQIIHRAHTSPVSVVVGFDQVCCKAFYDGDQIYFTLDAALALYFRINPIDWRRESPSHLRRAAKYQDKYGFTPIFPGLDFDLGRDLADPRSHGWYYVARSQLKSVSFYCQNVPPQQREKAIMKLRFDIDDYSLSRAINPVDLEGKDGWDQHQQHQDSDYGSDVEPIMALYYRCLSAAIKDRPERMLVFAKRPADIVENYDEVDVDFMMRKLVTSEKSTFYLGTERGRIIAEQMSRLTMRSDGRTCHLTLMSAKAMTKFTELHGELTQIFENRCQALYPMVAKNSEHLSKVEFLMSNPGAQFTASFHPIIRSCPRDYFGSRYVDVDLTVCKKEKYCCLWMWQRKLLFNGWDRNLLKYLFFWVDRAVIYSAMHPAVEAEVSSASKVTVFGVSVTGMISKSDLPTAVLNPLPWKEPKTDRILAAAGVLSASLNQTLVNNVGINRGPQQVALAPNLQALFNNLGIDTERGRLPPQLRPGLAMMAPAVPVAGFVEEDSEDDSDDDGSEE